MEKVKKELSYAEAIEEIETIIARLNEQNVDVDRLGEYVSRATELVDVCKAKLNRAETEVSKLLEK